MMYSDLYEDNRNSWNAATRAHNSHKRDQAGFFREGGSTLHPEDKELLGDVTGLALVHLFCNSGQDTLSLARLGAVVTGVDISDEAIAFAQKLSGDSGIPATFHRADVFEWLTQVIERNEQFDMAYCSYGAVHWVANLNVWARGIAAALKPGGRFVVVDFHPVAGMFDRDWNRTDPYFPSERVFTFESGVNDYVAMSAGRLTPFRYRTGIEHFHNPYQSHVFSWGLGEIVTALVDAGLHLEVLKEYPHSRAIHFNRMREMPGQRMMPPEDVPNLPLLFGIAARKV